MNLHKANTIACEVEYHDALKKIHRSISDTFRGILTVRNGPAFDEVSLRNISEWKSLFESDIQCLKLDFLCDELVKITSSAVSPSSTSTSLELTGLVRSVSHFSFTFNWYVLIRERCWIITLTQTQVYVLLLEPI